MFPFKLKHVVFLFIFQGYICQRRIQDGTVVTGDKRYVVYLLKAAVSPRYYEGWICGGALVTNEFIVTSAACVSDVLHLYAIAGYNKYVIDTQIYNDPCTKEKKKKIILTCTPKAYELKYDEREKWSNIDIAVVKVESPYDFEDNSYASICSYTPAPIIINYEMKYQEPGIDAMVFGWGHLNKWREQMDPRDYNQELLNYAPTLIQNKEDCKQHYAAFTGMEEIIDKYMICTFEKGNINEAGETILKSPPTAQGCTVQQTKLKGYEAATCDNANTPEEDVVLIDNSRKKFNAANATIESLDQKLDEHNETLHDNVNSNMNLNSTPTRKTYKDLISSRRFHTRRNGICQNDHGGPLVTWVGSHEVLIGVASVFKITEDLNCIGPYLFTSTQCNGAFLDCIIQSDPAKTEIMRRAICNKDLLQLDENHISWKDHPDGPADHERNSTNDIHAPTIIKETNTTSSDKDFNATRLVDSNFTITQPHDNTTTSSPRNMSDHPTRTSPATYVLNTTSTETSKTNKNVT